MKQKPPLWKQAIYQQLTLASLTLSLAPFVPEPHLLGKLRWVLGGAVGMQLVDWGDLLMHGAPWLGLIGYSSWYRFAKK
jgi:hypothetical protein